MIIKDEFDYLIHLIYCAIHDTVPEDIPDGVSFEGVLECGIRHDVANFAYLGLIKSGCLPDKELLERWRQRYLIGLQRNAKQMKARDEIIKKLHDSNIPTLEIQGTAIKRYYPSPDLRMMSDIDIIIPTEDLSEAERILSESGYSTENQQGSEVDGYRDNIVIEIHTDYFSKKGVCHDILKHPFYHEQLPLSVSDTTLYLYTILHCYKHYIGSGIGIRRIIDLYFLKTKLRDTVDFDEIDSILRNNGIYDTVNKLNLLALYWFDGKGCAQDLNGIADEVKLSGTHGSLEVRVKHELGCTQKAHRFYKIRYIFSKAFPDKQYIYERYPIYRQKRYSLLRCRVYRLRSILCTPGKRKLIKKYLEQIK